MYCCNTSASGKRNINIRGSLEFETVTFDLIEIGFRGSEIFLACVIFCRCAPGRTFGNQSFLISCLAFLRSIAIPLFTNLAATSGLHSSNLVIFFTANGETNHEVHLKFNMPSSVSGGRRGANRSTECVAVLCPVLCAEFSAVGVSQFRTLVRSEFCTECC